jgi:hypothetical protein
MRVDLDLTFAELSCRSDALLTEICNVLHLSTDQVKKYPHDLQEGRWSTRRVFSAETISRILFDTGGLYGAEERLARKQARVALRAERAIERAACAEAIRDARRATLAAALATEGCVIRSDSVLCEGFVDGTLAAEWTPTRIARELAICRYMFEHCAEFQEKLHKYEDAIEKEVHILSRRGKRYYTGIYDDATSNVTPYESRSEMIDSLKISFPIPALWPWMVASQGA